MQPPTGIGEGGGMIRADLFGAMVVVWAAASVGGYGLGQLIAPVAASPIMAGAASTAALFVVANVLFLIGRMGTDPPEPPEGPTGVTPYR